MTTRVFILFCKAMTIPPRILKSAPMVKTHLKNDANLMTNIYNSLYLAENDLVHFYNLYLNEREHQQKLIAEIQHQLDQKIFHHINYSETPIKNQLIQETKYQISQNFYHKLQSSPIFQGFSPSVCPKTIPNQVYLYFDGASRNNPGPAAIGYYATFNNQIFFQKSHHIGVKTNNQAEFTALCWAMLDCAINGIKRIKILGDSKLVIQGMNKNYKIVKKNLLEIKQICQAIQKTLDSVQYQFIYRNDNKHADQLANRAFKN